MLKMIIPLCIIILLNIICNIFALIIIFRTKHHLNLKDKLSTLLCATNLCQIIAYGMELCNKSYDQQTGYCQAQAFIVCFNTYSSIGCFAALILERFISVVYPFKRDVWFDSQHVKSTCLVLPVLNGFVFSVAPLFGWGKYGTSQNLPYCGFEFTDINVQDKVFLVSVIVFNFAIPVTFALVCFRYIIVEMRKSTSRCVQQFGKNVAISQRSQKQMQEQFLSSVLMSAMYLTSWLLYAVACFLNFFHVRVPLYFEYVAIFMAKSSTVSSPIVFCLVEKRFRKSLANIVTRSLSVKGGDMLTAKRPIKIRTRLFHRESTSSTCEIVGKNETEKNNLGLTRKKNKRYIKNNNNANDNVNNNNDKIVHV